MNNVEIIVFNSFVGQELIRMDNSNGHVMNLANSIIGVSVLAMPYCFKQCGIILSVLMLLISSIISRLACHFLLKSAITSRRKTYEFLAFHIFGSMGKLAVEIGMIGFLLGTCIAFFVVMGDLAPEIIAEITSTHTTNTLRTSILVALAMFVVLPLGLLRNVDSLNGVSRATIGFYCCLVLKVVFEAMPHLFSGDWYPNTNLWRPEGILQCLPIFSMALFCQSQLFEIYHAVQNATLDKMNNLVKIAVNICTMVYICVGIFGCIAFSSKPFLGNILLSFSPSIMTDIMKIGFILSVAFSFPLVIFPCRASLYSLLYKTGYSLHDGVSDYIPEGRFRVLTVVIIFVSLIIGIMIPNIELVLGLVGSTIGIMICVLFPVTCFICISPKNTNERLLAQFMLMVGIIFMVLGTYKNLHADDTWKPTSIATKQIAMDQSLVNIGTILVKLPTTVRVEMKTDMLVKDMEQSEIKEIRHEPPQPIEPVEEILKKELAKQKTVHNNMNPLQNETKNEEVDIEAIKKEDKEELMQENESVNDDNNAHQILIDTIQKQNEVQKEIVEQQKKLIEVIQNQQKKEENEKVVIAEEKLKAVKKIESIALQAIEKISEGEDSKKVMRELEKNIKENEMKLPEEKHPVQNLEEVSQQNLKQMEKYIEVLNNRSNMEVEHIPKPLKIGNNKITPQNSDIRKLSNINLNSNPNSIKPDTKTVVKAEVKAEQPKTDDVNLESYNHDLNEVHQVAHDEISIDHQPPQNGNLLIPVKDTANNTGENLAPLFLNLGKTGRKTDVGNLSDPVVVKIEPISKNSKLNILKDGAELKKTDIPEDKELGDDKMQAMRGEIL
ncbi:unnamed protein product [Phaedon cochleariae]|uniref:Amino acid transporter transmembrane domain-containing protein n=1 Tax=Phaedon cochleariae TaxID=80249 RepID=A0A9P0DRG6_PHACE|nr:unnamed protein product [Phaedon cochleariae]